MGMFDYIQAKCPECDEIMETQTKDGPCDLVTFVVEDMMTFKAASLVNGKAIKCDNCEETYWIEANINKIPVILSKHYRNGENDE